VCDDGGPSSALACYAGVEAPHSLREVADMLAAGLPTDRVYVSGRDGLRVLATGPRLGAGRSRAGVQLLLDQAREAHALTVVDCGTLARNAERLALANASHVAWVLPATAGAVQRARRVLEAVADRPLGRQLLVARPDPHQRKLPLAELKRLAEARHAALILLPALPDLGSGGGDDALAVAQVPLQAVHGLLAR
jgi:hypothetical protein